MLKIYFNTVIIWWIAFLAIRTISINSLVNNGWVDKNKVIPISKAIFPSFVISCLPVFRFLVVATLVVRACVPKPEWEKIVEEAKREAQEEIKKEENNNK